MFLIVHLWISAICYDIQLSNTIIGLLLELNEIINSNDDTNLILNILIQRVDNYKKYLLIGKTMK